MSPPPAPRPAAGPCRIVRLRAADAPAYRALMLHAYDDAPDAFTSTAAERARAPMAYWERRITAPDGLSESFGAFDGAALVGSAALEYSAKPKTGHRALLIGMFVVPSHRGAGTARALLRAAVGAAAARAGVDSVALTVTEGNEAALRLYRAAGFVAWGTEPRALRTPGGDRGKVHMVLDLQGRPR